MKALTVIQPWASFLAEGVKVWETRTWYTRYRGAVAIHAGMNRQHIDNANLYEPMADYDYPFGAIVAVGQLVEVRVAWTVRPEISTLEETLGDFSSGRYAWHFENVMKLHKPLPLKGKQGLWTPDDVTATLLSTMYSDHLRIRQLR